MIIGIAAVDNEFGIGKNNTIPWHDKEDFKMFKKVTIGHKIVMGRKTWESLPSVLENRTNIVLSKSEDYDNKEAIISNDIVWPDDDEDTLFVIGGSAIYEAYMPYMDLFYLTHIEGNYDCDTFIDLHDFMIDVIPPIKLSNKAIFRILKRGT